MEKAALIDRHNQPYKHHIPILGFVAMLVAYSVWVDSPDIWQRAFLTAALLLILRGTLGGWREAEQNRQTVWTMRCLLGFYLGLYFSTFMTLVYWRGSSFFWENANVFVFSFIMYGAFMFLNATFTKNEAPDEVGTKIILINQASVWILAWLALAILGFYFKPDLNIAQLGFFLIGLGFLVPPYVPADRRVRAAQSIPRRIGYGVLLVLLVADLFL